MAISDTEARQGSGGSEELRGSKLAWAAAEESSI
jgi:hypothetical protein